MKICCVFNYNPLYRWPIYHAMDEELECDFFFGDTVFQNIERFDANKLRGFQNYIIAKRIGHKGFIWHNKIRKIFFSHYTHYILTGGTNYYINWLILLYSKLTKKKIYYWTHGARIAGASRRAAFINKLFFKHADGIFLYGEYAIPHMVKLGCKQNKLHVIHNSLDTDVQTEIFNVMQRSDIYINHFSNHNPNAIYIGRLQKRKKIDELFNAIALCKQQGENINLIVVGPNEDDEGLTQLAKDLEIDNQVWYYGHCYEEEKIAELLYNADVSVCPAAVGLSCIHSLSYGTPVISNDDFENQMPEFEAIQEGVTGGFFQKGNIHDLAKKISYWSHRSAEEQLITQNAARKEILTRWSVDYQIGVLKIVLNE